MKTSGNTKRYYARRPDIFKRERKKPRNKTKQTEKNQWIN